MAYHHITRMITTAETGLILGVSQTTVGRMIRNRCLRAFRYTGSYRLDLRDVLEYKKHCELRASRTETRIEGVKI